MHYIVIIKYPRMNLINGLELFAKHGMKFSKYRHQYSDL